MSSVIPFRKSAPQLMAIRDYLQSSIGPRGGLKVFVSSVDHLTLTSTSVRIMRCLETESLVLEAVLMAMRAYLERFCDGGLFFGVLVAELVLHMPETVAQSLRSIILNSVITARMKVNFENVKQVLSIAKSVLSSKTWLNRRQVEGFSYKVVAAFLQGIPKATGARVSLTPLRVVFSHAMDIDCHLISGILHRFPEADAGLPKIDKDAWTQLERKKSGINILTMNIQLTEDYADMEEMRSIKCQESGPARKNWLEIVLAKVDHLCHLCQYHGVHVVFNQKRAIPEVLSRFLAKGILCHPRVGSSDISTLSSIAGSRLITSLSVNAETVASSIGHLDHIRIMRREGNRCFLHMSRDGGLVSTLLIEHWNEEIGEELKELCQKSIAALHNCLRHPYVVPGAGCLEAVILRNLLLDPKMKGEYRQVIVMFARLARGAPKMSPDALLDSSFGHLWQASADIDGEISQRCSCGMISKSQVPPESHWYSLMDLERGPTIIDNIKFAQPVCGDDFVCDSALLRTNQYEVAIETALSLSGVGLVLQI